MYSIFNDLFNDLFNDSLWINKNFYHSLIKDCDNRLKNNANKNINVSNKTPKNIISNSDWVETDDSWLMYIMTPDAEITVDEKTIEVHYNVINDKENSKWFEKGFFRKPFPKNSLPETIKAKKSDDGTYIKVSVNKAVIDKNPDRKKIVIE